MKQENLRDYVNIRDDGRYGKTAEGQVRYFLNSRTSLDRCQPLGKSDCTLYSRNSDGKRQRVTIEVKTGSGTVCYDTSHLDVSLPAQDHVNELYKGTDYIIYCPKYEKGDDVGCEFFVFTRDEFINFLDGYKTKTCKKANMLKYNTDNNKNIIINIQSFNSKAKEMYLWDVLACQPTLSEWKEANR